jgi:hypothetical protein
MTGSRPRRAGVRGPLGSLALALMLGLPAGGARSVPSPATGTWEALKIGAGGYVTGMDVDPTGTTFVLRTDTYGAYVGDGSGPWRQVVSARTMPASLVSSFTTGTVQLLGEGVYEIRVAPSDPNRLFMIFRRTVWRSDDRGTRWTQAGAGYVAGRIDPNDATRSYGGKMAIDPANPDVVYAGSAGGLYLTTNGGASWRLVPGIAAPAGAAGVTGIVFDGSSGTTGGRTNGIFATSDGRGVYHSADAGATWALLPGGPLRTVQAAVATDGVYYAAAGTRTVHKFAGGAFTSARLPTSQQGWVTVTTDPTDAGRVVFGDDSGALQVTPDRMVTWLEQRPAWGAGFGEKTRVARDIPWLATANESYMSSAALRFDPVVANKLWFAEGIGVWYSTNVFDRPTSTARIVWNSHSLGIEQLVGRDVLVPPGGHHVFTAGLDRSVFRVPRANASYPLDYVKMGSPAQLIAGWALEYSRSNPRHVVAIINGQGAGDLSGYSLDEGATWTKFPVQPAAGTSGDLAVPSIDDIIAIIGTGYAWRSTDRGASWSALSLPGASNTSSERKLLHDGYVVKKHVLAVDGVDPGTVYLYFHGHGVYRSTDRGATWSLVSGDGFDPGGYYHVKLRSVPGQAGHLFLTMGWQGGAGDQNPARTHLWRSTDGGVTWTTVTGIAEPFDVALGMALPGRAYPTIYVAGWYQGSWGIWRSTDGASTWTQIGPFPCGSLDEINVLKASTDVYGELYVAFQGSGWARYQEGEPIRPPP